MVETVIDSFESEATVTDDDDLIDYEITDEDYYDDEDDIPIVDREEPIVEALPYPRRHRNNRYQVPKYDYPTTPRFGRKPLPPPIPPPSQRQNTSKRRDNTASSRKSDPELYYQRLAALEDDGLGVSLPEYYDLHDQAPQLAPRQVQGVRYRRSRRNVPQRMKVAKSTNAIYERPVQHYQRSSSPQYPAEKPSWGYGPYPPKGQTTLVQDYDLERSPSRHKSRYIQGYSPTRLIVPDDEEDEPEDRRYKRRNEESVEEDEDERPEDVRGDYYRERSPTPIFPPPLRDPNSLIGGGSRLLRSSSGEKVNGLLKDDYNHRNIEDREEFEGTRRMPRMGRSNLRYKDVIGSYRAYKITLYKNGDQWLGGTDLIFRPGRDAVDLIGFLKMISVTKARTLDLKTSLNHIFDTDGARITSLDEIEDEGSYVVSETKKFIPANYGQTGSSFHLDNYGSLSRSNSRQRRPGYRSLKPNNESPAVKPTSGDGKIVRVINSDDHSHQYEVLLNLKTTQPFEDIIRDMGQVLQIQNADRMYTRDGREIKGFSQLKKELNDETVFMISSGPTKTQYEGPSEINNLLERTNLIRVMSEPNISKQIQPLKQQPLLLPRAPSKSPAPTNYNTEPIKVTIKGNRKLFYPPSTGYKESILPPPNRISLDWVYGYRGEDVKKNLWVLDNGELLYYVGAVAILYNRFDEVQRFYQEHTEDIQAMDLHPNREIVASGQRAGLSDCHDARCHFRVWNVKSLETLIVAGLGECEIGFTGITFSLLNNGTHIATIDASCDRIMSVYDWNPHGNLLGRVATHQEGVYGCSFHPLDNNLLITYGKNILTFWSRRKDGFFERTDVLGNTAINSSSVKKTINCVSFLESGDLVTGDDEGMISVFTVSNEGEYFMSYEYDAHSKGVNSLFMLTRGTLLSGGEKDRRIVAWDTTRDFEKIVETKLPEGVGSSRTVTPQYPGRNDGTLYVGTTKNVILEGSLQRKFNLVVWGHSKTVDAVASHPDDLSFVTAGYDKVVAKWRKQRLVWKLGVQMECSSIDYYPGGSVIAVGTVDGHIVVLNAENGAHVTTLRVCGSALNALTYSPLGDVLAAASQNGYVYLFKVSKDGFTYKKYGKLGGGGGGVPLSRLDWSEDGEYFQTVSTDYTSTFWNFKTHKMEKNPANVRDVKWSEHTCTLGFPVSGVWNNLNYRNDPSIPTTVHTGSRNIFVGVGDHHGYLRLFRYPCVNPRAEYLEQKFGTGPVLGLDIFFDDSYVVTLGGGIHSPVIMRWKIR